MPSLRRIRKQLEEQNQFYETWAEDVRASRIVIRPDDTSYLPGVGVYVSTIVRRLAEEGTSYETIMHDYPNLTKEDIDACLKFEVVRARRKL